MLVNLDGSLNEAATVRAGFNFQYPLRVGHVKDKQLAARVKEVMQSIQFSGSDNVVLETIKRGEDDVDVGSAATQKQFKNVILRIYEAYGGRGTGQVTMYLPIFIAVY